ncbi:TRAP transporter small permease [Clostridium aminobutyricum]|uniref:TRAP transporter small permease n=1 Tax=Clostridium aminobutyricum TaxID=33953 RepID=A0A939D9F5_CLOAM|nr:TRAP transporter small permease [Clostridium aminobutyricum]MBN7773565.1 TRAP transporter small permease [Clostridium aminobutyricum]
MEKDLELLNIEKNKSPVKKAMDLYNNIEEYFLIGSLMLTVLFIFYQVVMRYVFNDAPSWTEELSRYLFIWFSWLGTSLGLRQNEHIRVQMLETAFIRRGKLKSKNVLLLFIYFVWIFLTIVLTVTGFQYTETLISMNSLSAGMRIPIAYVAISVPIACLAVSIRLIARISTEFKKLIKGGVA